MSSAFSYLSDDFLEVIRPLLRFDTYAAASDRTLGVKRQQCPKELT